MSALRRSRASLVGVALALAAPSASADESTAPPEPPAKAPDVAEEVMVSGQRGPHSGSRAREPLRDVPATVNVLTERELRERATMDAVSALAWVPGVNPQLTYGGFTYMTVRGFGEFVTLVDGMRDDRYTLVQSAPTGNLAGIERIEVLKGPASALYGYGGIGGVISYVHKSPSRRFAYEGSLTLGGPTWMRRATAGVTGPLGESLAYRVDAGIVDDEDFRRARTSSGNVRAVLEWRPSPAHKLVIRAAFEKMHFGTDTGLPTRDGLVPKGLPFDRRLNTPWDYLDGTLYDGRIDYTFAPAPWAELAVRLGASHNPYRYKSAEMLAVGPNDTVARDWFFLEHQWSPAYLQLEAHAKGRLLVPHRALVGYELGSMTSRHPRPNLEATALAPVPFADAPDPQGDYAVPIDARRARSQTTHAFYVHDTLTLVSGLKLALSGRVDHWAHEERNVAVDATGAPQAPERVTTRATLAASGRAGVVLQPAPWATLYGVIGTGFQPVRVVPQDGRSLDPERGRQLEVGARLDALEGAAHVDVAVYDITKTDVVVARGGGVYEQAGAQSARGVELNATVTDLGGLSLRAGYAYTHARFERFVSATGDYSGKIPASVPDHTLTLWGTYRFENGVGLGAGFRAIGPAWADPANTVAMPAYGLVDAAVYYATGPVEAAVNVGNLLGFERYFVSTINDTQLTPGAPRTVLVSLRYRP